MPCVTYLSDNEAERFRFVVGDEECNELLSKLNKLSGRTWLIEVRNFQASRGWFRRAAEVRTYTLYLDCHGEYQIINLVSDRGGSVFSYSTRADVMNFMLGYISAGETKEDDRPLSDAEIRAGINILLETIAKKFEAYDTLDIWRSDAADIVRSYKHSFSGETKSDGGAEAEGK